MAQRCTVCDHAERQTVDERLASGMSNRAVASQFGLGKDAVRRHRDAHLSPSLIAVTAEVQRREANARTTLERVESLTDRLEEIATTATGRAFLDVARELRGALELLARMRGELKPDGPQVAINLLASPDLHRLVAAIDRALAGHPEARAAVAAELALLAGGVPRLAGSNA
jgi:transposase